MSLSSIQDVYVFELLHGGSVCVNTGMVARVFVYVKGILSESGLPSSEPLRGFCDCGIWRMWDWRMAFRHVQVERACPDRNNRRTLRGEGSIREFGVGNDVRPFWVGGRHGAAPDCRCTWQEDGSTGVRRCQEAVGGRISLNMVSGRPGHGTTSQGNHRGLPLRGRMGFPVCLPN